MLSSQILKEIEEGKITSRRQLYKQVGRSKKLLRWLNENSILVPNKWDKGRVKAKLLQMQKNLNRIPKASDDPNITKYAQVYFGTWNNALREVFSEVNQRWHNHLNDQELLDLISQHIKRYQRLPLREEFDGKTPDYPYWETYVYRFDLTKWSDVFKLIPLQKLKYFPSKKHGTGKVKIYKGVVYLSHQKYLIGKYLTDHEIRFEKEVPYGNSNYIFDFYLTDFNVYIEYYGLSTPNYLKKMETKRRYYAGRNVIEIFKHDNTVKKLDSKVQRL